MKVLHEISSRWTALWATTYTFEPGFFESFVLRRMGDPPLNVVVLADQRKLAETWSRIDPAEAWRVSRANRHYLVRGLAAPGGAFHAKTMLLANATTGRLLVGSGNLTMSGMEHGRESIVRFDAAEQEDLPAFGAWRAWMTSLVDAADDPVVRSRWATLIGTVRWLPAESAPARFVTNHSEPILDQLLVSGWEDVDELVATAPFFDADLMALRTLVERARPRRLRLLMGEGASVDGRRLRGVLSAFAAEVSVERLDPPAYVHAKLVALIRGDQARVLSGSANLSRPALLATFEGGNGNVEAGVIVECEAQRAREWLTPYGHTWVPVPVEELDALSLSRDSDGPGFPVLLRSASRQPDGRISVRAENLEGVMSPVLTDGTSVANLVDGVSRSPFPVDRPAMVWIQDTDGTAHSNRVPLDDEAVLRGMLAVREDTGERPSGLDDFDAGHPLGRLLAGLHRNALFDIDDTPASRRADQLAQQATEADEQFWEQFRRDELLRDPRFQAYGARRRFGEPSSLGDLGEFGWLLDQMLGRVPSPQTLRLITGEILTTEQSADGGHRWSMDTRRKVRVTNVLERWCRAVADDRARWLSDFAPVDHYIALLDALAQIWAQGEEWLGEARVVRLLLVLLGAFVRTERTPGYLSKRTDAERTQALERLSGTPAPGIAAALVHGALATASPNVWFDWQSALRPAMEWGVVRVDERTPEILRGIKGTGPAPDLIRARLELVATYTDDEHWCAHIASELGLAQVRLTQSGNPNYPLQVNVTGVADAVQDPRMVRLVREVMSYRKGTAVRLLAGSTLLAIKVGEPLFGKVDGIQIGTDVDLTNGDLERLDASGSGFASLLPGDVAA